MWHILQILHKQSFKTHNTVTNISREQPTKKGGRDNKFQMCSGQDGTGGDGGGYVGCSCKLFNSARILVIRCSKQR